MQRSIQIYVSSIDIEMTNKELKELKDFIDNTKKYHE